MIKFVVLVISFIALFSKISWKASRKRNRVLRSMFHAMPFQHVGESILAALLLYQFRGMERQMGSRKYGAFLIYCSIIGYGIQSLALKWIHRESATGLYPIIFANMVGYYLDIPPQSSFSALGISLSDKSFIYLLAMQMMMSVSGKSFVSAMSGILAGMLYFSNFLHGQNLQLPHALVSLL